MGGRIFYGLGNEMVFTELPLDLNDLGKSFGVVLFGFDVLSLEGSLMGLKRVIFVKNVFLILNLIFKKLFLPLKLISFIYK